MSKIDFDVLYGYYLLAEEGLVVYNSKYVGRYGKFMRCCMRLKSKHKSNEAYLLESYTESAHSAKFFATYPRNLSGMSTKELRALRRAAVKNISSTSC